jgi:hypothetical protein
MATTGPHELRRSGGAALALAAACGAWLAAAACASFSSEGGSEGSPAEAGADTSSEAAPGPEAGTDATPSCDQSKVASDPNHCGKCGHSCLGGACVASQCAPAVLATMTALNVLGPVLDGTRAVVVAQDPATGGAHVGWCAKSGCTAPLPGVDFTSMPSSDRALASDGTSVYVGTAGGVLGAIYRIGQDGKAIAVVLPGATADQPDGFTILGPDLFFLTAYQAAGIGIYRVPVDGHLSASLVVPIQPNDRWVHTAVTPGTVYVNDYQSIARCVGATCAALEPWATAPAVRPDVTGLVTDGTSVFWTSDFKALLSCAVASTCTGPAGPATQVGPAAMDNGTPIRLSLHGGDLYVTTDAGNIYTCTAATCGATFHRIVTDQVVVGAAAADDAAVYWVAKDRAVASDPDAGPIAVPHRLMRLAK